MITESALDSEDLSSKPGQVILTIKLEIVAASVNMKHLQVRPRIYGQHK